MSRPAKREPLQPEEMTALQQSKSSSKLYAAETSEYKKAELANFTRAAHDRLTKVARVDKINLSTATVPEVAAVVEQYLTVCEETQTIPSVANLATCLGYSRAGLDYHLNHFPDSKVSQYLGVVKEEFAAILDQASLTNSVNTIAAIFTLKSIYSRKETMTIEAVPQNNSLAKYDVTDIQERARILRELEANFPPEDDDYSIRED